jgi:hypothetical protein
MRAQVAMEFVILVSIVFMVMIVFTAFIMDYTAEEREQREYILLKDVFYAVQGEINLATTVEDGYSRTFTVPQKIEGINFTIYIEDGLLWVMSNKSEYVDDIPDLVGNITKGNNTITKDGGVVYLNP